VLLMMGWGEYRRRYGFTSRIVAIDLSRAGSPTPTDQTHNWKSAGRWRSLGCSDLGRDGGSVDYA
jgi:hypothetical protein